MLEIWISHQNVVVFLGNFDHSWRSQSCSTSSPGGNQVDGLPPAARTGAGVIGQRVAQDKSISRNPIYGSSSGSLWSIAVRLCMQFYIHMNLYLYQAACLYLHSTWRTPCRGALFGDPKWSEIDDKEIDSGSFQACVGVTRDTSEWC